MIEALVDAWTVDQCVAGISERSVAERRRIVMRLAAHVDPVTAGADDVVRFLVSSVVKAHTRTTYRSYLSIWFDWLTDTGQRDSNPLRGASTRRRPPGIRDPRCREPLFPIRWRQPVAEYIEHCRASGHAAGTVKHRLYALARLARAHPDPWCVTHRDLIAHQSNDSWSLATKRSELVTMRSFFRWAELEHRNIREDPSMRLPKISVPRGRPRPTPAAIVRQALARADDRGRLMLMLGAHAGLRRSEIAKVHSRDVSDGMLRVTGKGGKTRTIPLSAALEAAVEATGDGYLFPGQVDGHVSADRVAQILTDLLGDGWTAHTLRHAFATKAYAVDRDLLAVQELLGHSSPQTTAIYAAVPSDAMQRAVAAAAS